MFWEGINRRGFPRANYACVVILRQKGSSEAFHTKTENIGCGGICVILPKEINLFGTVEVELDLEDGETKISCDGVAVWVVRRSEAGKDASVCFDTGIEFANLKEKDKGRIDKVIKRCLRQK
ncbi:MAG: PilZ domain-containing protein [Candidatus Omnitrophota bacterium]